MDTKGIIIWIGFAVIISALVRLLPGESTDRQEGDILVSIGFLDPLNALLTMGSLFADDLEDG